MYEKQIEDTRHTDHGEKIGQLELRARALREDELRLGRLLLTKKISEEAYDKLRQEWKEKVRQVSLDLQDLERDAGRCLDDLDVALHLLARCSELYERFDHSQRAVLLQILARRIVIAGDGKIVDHELHAPFAFLLSVQHRLASVPKSQAVEPVDTDEGGFLASVRFEQRARLAALDIQEHDIKQT
jgi:hypothetical protein